MAGEERGWICLYRSIQDHWLWQEKPFDKARAWIHLLLSANHKDNKILIGNELVLVKKGSFITSEIKLMEQWKWSKEKVRKFLKLLEKDNMIKKIPTKKYTIIEILNYEQYQNQTNSNQGVSIGVEEIQTQNRPKIDYNQTMMRPKADYIPYTNNNDNNDNNVNNDNNSVCLGEFKNVILKKSEYEKLINTHTKPIVDKYVDRLSDYMESEGKTYKSHYATIKRWIKSDKDKINNKQQEQQPNKPKDEYGYDMAKIRKQLLGVDDGLN